MSLVRSVLRAFQLNQIDENLNGEHRTRKKYLL